jgi:hypothetical protein
MSSGTDSAADWWAWVASVNEQYADVAEGTVAAQGRLLEAWAEAVEGSADEAQLEEGLASFLRAHQVWMDAAERTLEQTNDLLDGEDVEAERFRDTWLTAANQAFKEVMRTAAFAAATGESVDATLDAQQRVEDVTTATLHGMQLPARADVEEVGERLVELEHRQHAVEGRLDEVLEVLASRE